MNGARIGCEKGMGTDRVELRKTSRSDITSAQNALARGAR